ncbi:protein NRT1/ PTR FAMILY 5.6-like [Cucurbita pepo subsp. pepo]|uniref:protein NRT1/ PTR FAMILY 5.6-like n=1 Tax=Cucurbita pepo subsp. pepo TaxID=3664 RepID=UPI000C9D5243|nr:protein NRT1/ PTR FAMILY 5.6-like [Cucurbita pepo subsp. pepo]
MKTEAENRGDDQILVHDSSVDHKRRLPLRASTGVWKASLFIIAIEFSERLSYFGIATSLVIYLTRVIRQDLKTAARNVNYWTGVTTLMPLLGGFLADAYLGRFSTVLVSTIVYLFGLSLLTLSTLVPSLKACGSEPCDEPRKLHEVLFFTAIYLISVGTGGHKPSLESFGADQFDDDHVEERKQKMSFFNWWNSGLCAGVIFGVTLIVYVQEHVGWGMAGVILTSVMATSLAIFLVGRPVYRYRAPLGSPLTPLLQVLVAAFTRRNLPYPSDSAHLYEVQATDKVHGRLLTHTNRLKFLDKAAIVGETSNSAGKQSPWRLATVTRVEELKLVLNMIPIWIASIPFGICVAQTYTFFIKQCATLDRKIGNTFIIPTSSMFCLAAVGMIISVAIYDRLLVPILRKTTGNERGITILQRIGIGMIFSFMAMSVAGLVERKRLGVVKGSPTKGSGAMSVFWLGPQFLIIGIADGFALVGLQEYFYDQVPDSMRSLGIAFYLSVNGAANFVSSLLITAVDRITGNSSGGKSWFGDNLNTSRLDHFYWLIAGIVAVNLCFFVLFARQYAYKSVQRTTVADCFDGDGKAGGVTSAV